MQRRFGSRAQARKSRRLRTHVAESLEDRLLLTLTFTFDYTYDTSNFFNTQARKDVLELAGQLVGSQFSDTLEAITPGGSNTWRANFARPDTGANQEVTDPVIAENELLVFVGSRALNGSVGNGGFGGFFASGTTAFRNAVDYRGQVGELSGTDFGPWGGQLTFDSQTNWHFGESVEGLSGGETDFLSVAVHELHHLMGFGIAGSWTSQVDNNGQFTGPASVAEYDLSGNVPLSGSQGHWASSTLDEGRETAMDPGIAAGTRKLATRLDTAGLVDIGWEFDTSLTQDFGDAPAGSYPTLSADNGARHTLGGGLTLGVTADPEADGQSSSNATGDDSDEFNDDDGVVFNDALSLGTTVSLSVTSSAAGLLDAWIDFNGDGDWSDSGEQIFSSQSLSSGLNAISFTVPGTAVPGTTFARFRVSSSGGLSYTGAAADGEVEDYQVEIVGPIAAVDDTFTGGATQTLNVLSNDFPSGQGRVLDFTQPASGTVTDNHDGTLAFTADTGFSGTTSFQYTIAFLQDKVAGSSTAAGDEFGRAVAISGDLAVVGVATEDNTLGVDAGAAYIFERSGLTWTQVRKLTASDGVAADRFGFSVSIDGDTVAVGARQADVNGTNDGAVYIFRRGFGGLDAWGQVAKLTGSGNSTKDHFGHSVSLSGTTLAVGARLDDGNGTNSGSVYVFEQDLGGPEAWGERTRIKASNAAGGDQFGYDVALNGNNLIVGARKSDSAAADAGAVYFLNRDAGGTDNWGEFGVFTAPDAVQNDWFGSSVAIDGSYAIVGKPIRNNRARSGSAYTYSKSGPTWTFVKKIEAAVPTDEDQFGYDVALNGNTAIAGSRKHDGAAQNAGMVAVHQRNQGGTNSWGLDYELFTDDIAQGDYFGEAVAIDGDWILAGSPFDDDDGSKSGTVSFQEIATTDTGTVTIVVVSAGSKPPGGGSGGGSGSGDSSGSGGSGNQLAADADEPVIPISSKTRLGTTRQDATRCCCSGCLTAFTPAQVSAGMTEPPQGHSDFETLDDLFRRRLGLFG